MNVCILVCSSQCEKREVIFIDGNDGDDNDEGVWDNGGEGDDNDGDEGDDNDEEVWDDGGKGDDNDEGMW